MHVMNGIYCNTPESTPFPGRRYCANQERTIMLGKHQQHTLAKGYLPMGTRVP